MSKAKLYKVLEPGGKPAHGGSGEWHLPVGRKPGKWMPVVEDPVCCKRGYHLVTAVQLLAWLNREGLEVWEAEGSGTHSDQADKSAWSRARLVRKVGTWTDRNARLFTADCAEAVLHVFEKERPGDDRPRKAIKAARAFAFGRIDAAARAAAWAAAWDAVWDAAGDAAWDAVGAAVGAAAGDAAWAAARDAARDAARAAAGAAAWDAAWDAARDAAWAAVGAAAWDAQSRRLLYWLRRAK